MDQSLIQITYIRKNSNEAILIRVVESLRNTIQSGAIFITEEKQQQIRTFIHKNCIELSASNFGLVTDCTNFQEQVIINRTQPRIGIKLEHLL